MGCELWVAENLDVHREALPGMVEPGYARCQCVSCQLLKTVSAPGLVTDD